jgi:hypothetical protein
MGDLARSDRDLVGLTVNGREDVLLARAPELDWRLCGGCCVF